jgi:hypothetical protein
MYRDVAGPKLLKATPAFIHQIAGRDRLKKMSAAGYALQHGEQKIPYRPLRKRVGTA